MLLSLFYLNIVFYKVDLLHIFPHYKVYCFIQTYISYPALSYTVDGREGTNYLI